MDNDRRRVAYVRQRYPLTATAASDFAARAKYHGEPDAALTPAQRRRAKRKRANGDANDITPPAGDQDPATASDQTCLTEEDDGAEVQG